MNNALSETIEKDLFNELRWLLCAATEWEAQEKLIGVPPQIPKIKEPCAHLKVYAMYSAFLHARSLYEFFTATRVSASGSKGNLQGRLTWRDFSKRAHQTSTKYTQFMIPLHGRVMHLDKNRTGYDEIKKEVVNFATDILNLWNAFSKKPGLSPYAGSLDKLRDQAIREAESVAAQYKEYGFKCPFTVSSTRATH